MVKINGKEISASEDSSLIKSLLSQGDLKKIKDSEYIWTEKHLKKTERNYRTLYKLMNYPLYRLYYNLMKQLGIKK